MGTPESLALLRAKDKRRKHEGSNGYRPESQHAIALECAKHLPQPFLFSDLLIRCHQVAPRLFGLDGKKMSIPDARVLHNVLYAKRGLLTLGHLCRLPDGRLRTVETSP